MNPLSTARTCEGCGALVTEASMPDAAWFMDMIQIKEAVVALVLCPECK